MASWNNAPPLLQIAASQQGGPRGAQLWGITRDYGLVSTYQETPGGKWSAWIDAPWVAGGPTAVLQVTACQQNDGRVQLWVTDQKQQLWSIWQTSPGGGWSAWSGPNWNGATTLMQICACQQGGPRGAQLWATTAKGTLLTTYQVSPGGNWTGWGSFRNPPGLTQDPPPLIDLAAAEQNNGHVQLWALDQQQQIWTVWQTVPGGNWTAWVGPNWGGSQTLQTLTASQQGGSRGAQLWATDQSNQVWSTYQETPGGGWALWLGPNWAGAPPFIQMAAAQQNNGCVQVWGLDQTLSLKSITQNAPGGNWSAWGP